jgi:hypothetical protein
MTSQILDTLLYQNNDYIIIGVNGNGLLSPQNFGMLSASISTACTRGYYSQYSCVDGRLLLKALTVTLKSQNEYKKIGDIHPVGDPDWLIKDKYRAYRYNGLNITTSFSGGFLIAKRLVAKSGPFGLPQSYETIVEIILADGILIETIDCSETVAKSRNDFLQRKPNFSLEIKFFIDV